MTDTTPQALSDERLKPCPFCGSTKIDTYQPDAAGSEMHAVLCTDCTSEGGWRHSEAEAIGAWNRRAAHEEAAAAREPAHVGNSSFEVWYAHHAACPDGASNIKQMARDAYAAGMSDPAATPQPVAVRWEVLTETGYWLKTTEREAFNLKEAGHTIRSLGVIETAKEGKQHD